ncbi:MAG: NAD(P)-binding domain-containing protein, partial [Geminicoccaceae bacterium]
MGCGNMGGGMAAQLLERGQDVHCFDPDPDVLAGMKALGATCAAS